jgi:hypothetical protein
MAIVTHQPPTLREIASRTIRELLGGPQRVIRRWTAQWSWSANSTRDQGVTDYAYYDRLRKGRVQGLEVSGLLVKPLCSKIAAWTIGTAPTVKYSNSVKMAEKMNQWFLKNHALILQTYKDALELADMYLVVNGDLSLTAVSPNIVRPIVDPRDYSRIIGWRIDENIPHPTEPGRYMHIRDEYTRGKRVRTLEIPGFGRDVTTYTLPIDMIPVIKVSNNRSADELFGRAEAEAMLPLLQKYGEIIQAGHEGNMRQGRPLLAIERMGDATAVNQFWELYGKTRNQTLADGTIEQEQYLDLTSDKTMTLGGEATVNWKSPGPFIGETAKLLELYFYLYVQHSEMPEWALGNAIASSMASANTQVEPLVKFIEMKRSIVDSGWMRELLAVVQAYYNVLEPAAATKEEPQLKWADLTRQDGTLTLNAMEAAADRGFVDSETYLQQIPVEIEDIPAVLKKAAKEKEERDAANEEMAMQRAVNQSDLNAADQEKRDAAGQGEDEKPAAGTRPVATAA